MNKGVFQRVCFGAAGLLLLAGCGGDRTADPGHSPKSEILAQVGDRILSPEGFMEEVARWRAARRPVTESEAVVREWVERESLLQRARAAGLEDDPAIRREVEALLVSRLLERQLAPRLESVEVSESELRAEYDRDLGRFTQPARVRLAILFQNVGRKSGETHRAEAQARLEEARSRILADPAPGGRGPAASGFGAVAAEVSDDQASRFRGGDLGWLEPVRFDYRWPRAVLEAGYALDLGQVSEVLDTDAGLYVVMKTDERPAVVQPFEQVETGLRQTVLARQRQQLDAAYRQEAVRAADATIDAVAVAAVPLPAAATNVARRDPTRPPGVPGGIQPE
jgi:peptidyl-prolyl cis-trans isomerase C